MDGTLAQILDRLDYLMRVIDERNQTIGERDLTIEGQAARVSDLEGILEYALEVVENGDTE